SQIDEHKIFKGVVPEIAARAHLDKIDLLIREALNDAGLAFKDLDAVAVTSGPGLVGGLIVGVMYAKTISYLLKIPLIEVNHLEAHLLTARITDEISFPYLSFLISGGHTQIVETKSIGSHRIIGRTLDDAIGEAFDKVGKLLNLDYPCGPEIEKLAQKGKIDIGFPVPLKGKQNCDFSLSGLKTSVRNYISKLRTCNEGVKQNICYSFQIAVSEMIKDRLKKAFLMITDKKLLEHRMLVVSGGAASNKFLRSQILEVAKENSFTVVFPPISLCTDNGVMVAWLGVEKYLLKQFAEISIQPKSRWDLK
ncbi:MAG: tRNA (adenosine(37)-N6)-threonylcarbamoyltransferase complex transferase subunit TsaD, partial [Rickettsiales bacterium]